MKLMCNNKEVECLGEEFLLIESNNNNQLQNQAVFVAMENNNSSSIIGSNNFNNLNMNLNMNDESSASRVKFLCSFGGSILPRPQDGKLRYVGGETRIVSVPRDIRYEELMGKMRELYEATAIFKYQQPEEDLDALVSVVNDDDVTNMMEEYDKLGSGDGFTRLRIFLFSHPEQDSSLHYMDGDERDTERRYVDALNSLCESPECRRLQHFNDSPVMTPLDEVHIADQMFSSMNLEGSVHNQRNFEMGMPQYNLRKLAIPSMGSGQHLGHAAQRYNEETQTPWSPAFYSPRCGGPHDTRTYTEYPSSPSSARYRMPYQEVADKCVDRMPDESSLQQGNGQIPFDPQQQYSDNLAWMPPGGMPIDRGGFPGNILNGHSVLDRPSVCENCKMTFQRNPAASDYQWRPEGQSHVEQSAVANGYPHVANQCVECFPKREPVMLNTDPKLQHSIAGVGRMGEHYNLDGPGANITMGPNNLPEGHLVPPPYAPLEDSRYPRPGAELGGEVFHGQTVAAGSQAHVPLEERGVHATNLPYSYGTDTPHQVLHGHPSSQAMWRNVSTPVHVPPVYDPSNLQLRNGMPSPSVPRANVEASPRFFVGVDQSPWGESSRSRLGVEGSTTPESPYGHFSKLSAGAPMQEIHPTYPQDPLRNTPNISSISPIESLRPSTIMNDNMVSSGARDHTPVQRIDASNAVVRLDERNIHHESNGTTHLRKAERPDIDGFICTQVAGYKSQLFDKLNGQTKEVLEIGVGTGTNFKYYASDARMVFGIDPNRKMEKYTRRAADAAGLSPEKFKFVQAVGEALPLDDASVDTVIGTLVLCSVKDVPRTLQEIKRVLKPGGLYLFVEHVAAKDGTSLRLLQKIFNPLQQLLADGCHLTRETEKHISEAGFSSVNTSTSFISSALFINPHLYGIAHK